MRIFESQEEYNAYELEKLLDLINNQRTIYALNFNEDTRELNYRIIYGLNDISERSIKLTDKDYDDQKTLKLVETILLRFSLLKRKTRENINEYLINEYIKSIPRSRMPLEVMDEIDKKALLERVKERKNDITHFVDEEIATRVALTTIENIAVTSIVNLIDQSITKYLLAYTVIAPFLYSYVPFKIDNIKNTIKYNRVVGTLEKEEYLPKPNLKLFCVVNEKVHELEGENPKLFASEIQALKEIMENCYTNNRLEEDTIDLEIIQQIEEVYSRIELKKLNRKTISFTEYLAKRQQAEYSTEEKKAKSK